MDWSHAVAFLLGIAASPLVVGVLTLAALLTWCVLMIAKEKYDAWMKAKEDVR